MTTATLTRNAKNRPNEYQQTLLDLVAAAEKLLYRSFRNVKVGNYHFAEYVHLVGKRIPKLQNDIESNRKAIAMRSMLQVFIATTISETLSTDSSEITCRIGIEN